MQKSTGLIRAASDAANRFLDTESYRLAASLSFYAMSSVFPLLLVAVAVGDLALGDSSALQAELVGALDATDSLVVRSLVQETLANLSGAGARGGVGLVIGVAGAIVGASGVFLELDAALEKLFRVKASQTSVLGSIGRFFRERVTAFGLVLGTAALLLVCTLSFGAVRFVAERVLPASPLLFELATRGTAFAVLLFALTLCFRVVPARHVTLRAALTGAAVTAVALSLAGPVLGWAVFHLTNYAAYGLVGGLLLLSTWFYVAGTLLLFGAALSATTNEQPSRARREAPLEFRRHPDAEYP